jgi:hypothetical protein
MKGDIALAGFVLTAEEWEALDALSRAQLVAAATRQDEPWFVGGLSGVLSEATRMPPDRAAE